MSESYDVADAKSRFSELLNRAAFSRERFLIRKRGRPVAAIVSTEDLARLESDRGSEGLRAAAGALAEHDDWSTIMEEVVHDREMHSDRDVAEVTEEIIE